jgi:hypothetical protein
MELLNLVFPHSPWRTEESQSEVYDVMAVIRMGFERDSLQCDDVRFLSGTRALTFGCHVFSECYREPTDGIYVPVLEGRFDLLSLSVQSSQRWSRRRWISHVNFQIMPVMSAINFGDKLASDKPVRLALYGNPNQFPSLWWQQRDNWDERCCATGNAISAQSRAEKSHIW